MSWVMPQEVPKLVAGEVQVWRLTLPAEVEALLSGLSEEERERAARFRHDGARRHFVGGRAALRWLVGRARGEAAAAVEFQVSAFGKLSCAGGPEFNVTHSGDVVLIALTLAGAVGVDVEQLDRATDVEAVAEKMYTAAEQAAVGGDRRRFFQMWALKEAVIKADGRGLSMSTTSFEVGKRALEADEEVCVAVNGREMRVRALPVGDGLGGAVAMEIPAQVRLLSFPFRWLAANA